MERAIEVERQRSNNPNQLLLPAEPGLEGTCILSSSQHGKFDPLSLLNSVRTSILFEGKIFSYLGIQVVIFKAVRHPIIISKRKENTMKTDKKYFPFSLEKK